VGKAKRLLEVIERMKNGQKFTVRSLANEFGVSYRTMLRDLQEIGEMGVPLYSENGVHGGYRVLKRESKPSLVEPLCKLINVPAFHAIGFAYTMPMPSSGEAEVLIPRLWLHLEQRIDEIGDVVNRRKRTSVIIHRPEEAVVHVCYEVRNLQPVPSGMIGLSVPARQYVIYPHRGAMDKANRLRTGQRAAEWIKQAGIEVDPTLSVEWYDDERFDPFSPHNEFHFLLAIRSAEVPPITTINS
jgi:predicted transcriptional regulator YdeE